MAQKITTTLVIASQLTLAAPPPSGLVGVPYSFSLQVSGGTPPYIFTSSGLAPGLSMDGNGNISGTPTAGGSGTITITDSTP